MVRNGWVSLFTLPKEVTNAEFPGDQFVAEFSCWTCFIPEDFLLKHTKTLVQFPQICNVIHPKTKTDMEPENRPFDPKGKESSFNHCFSQAFAATFRRYCIFVCFCFFSELFGVKYLGNSDMFLSKPDATPSPTMRLKHSGEPEKNRGSFFLVYHIWGKHRKWHTSSQCFTPIVADIKIH